MTFTLSCLLCSFPLCFLNEFSFQSFFSSDLLSILNPFLSFSFLFSSPFLSFPFLSQLPFLCFPLFSFHFLHPRSSPLHPSPSFPHFFFISFLSHLLHFLSVSPLLSFPPPLTSDEGCFLPCVVHRLAAVFVQSAVDCCCLNLMLRSYLLTTLCLCVMTCTECGIFSLTEHLFSRNTPALLLKMLLSVEAHRRGLFLFTKQCHAFSPNHA